METRNRTLSTLFNKTISYDFFPVKNSHDTVIFIPGFKGFKDWGPWDLVAERVSSSGFNFIKANLSHNGIDLLRDPYEITDLIAFANNNFSIELNDISRLVDEAQRLVGEGRIALMGHSRGGALSLLAASHDIRPDTVVSWASPGDFENHFFSEHIPQWEREGVYFIKNNRNGEDLPLRYQLYQDYILNYDRLHIPSRVAKIVQPFLAIHGDADETVPLTALEVMKKSPQGQTHVIPGAGHSFGASHPWNEAHLPKHLDEVVTLSIDFLKKHLV